MEDTRRGRLTISRKENITSQNPNSKEYLDIIFSHFGNEMISKNLNPYNKSFHQA